MNEGSEIRGGSTESEKRPRSTWLIFLLALAILFIALAFLWWYFQLRAYGEISSPTGKDEPPMAQPEGKKEFNGKSVTFFYPERYSEKPSDGPVTFPQIDRLILSGGGLDGKKLTLLVQDNTGYKFEEYSSYRIREMDKKTYAQEVITKNGLNITLFTKATSVYEVGAFFQNGPLVISLVVSSPIGLSGLQEELLSVLETVTLKSAL